jgi:hypothetical protein
VVDSDGFFGHVERKNKDWISRCRDMKVDSRRGRGMIRKTWMEGIWSDMKSCSLKREVTKDRKMKNKIAGNRLTRTCEDIKHTP